VRVVRPLRRVPEGALYMCVHCGMFISVSDCLYRHSLRIRYSRALFRTDEVFPCDPLRRDRSLGTLVVDLRAYANRRFDPAKVSFKFPILRTHLVKWDTWEANDRYFSDFRILGVNRNDFPQRWLNPNFSSIPYQQKCHVQVGPVTNRDKKVFNPKPARPKPKPEWVVPAPADLRARWGI
jgi:hypothetical protein